MRHRKDGFKLGRVTAHRWALFRNLLVALFRHERIQTTEAKAKAVRGLAEQMITLAKRDTLHARRQVLAMVPDTEVVGQLFGTIAPRLGERNGGYTRLIRAGRRAGDNAPPARRPAGYFRCWRKRASVRFQASAAPALLYASGRSSLKNAWSTPG